MKRLSLPGRSSEQAPGRPSSLMCPAMIMQRHMHVYTVCAARDVYLGTYDIDTTVAGMFLEAYRSIANLNLIN